MAGAVAMNKHQGSQWLRRLRRHHNQCVMASHRGTLRLQARWCSRGHQNDLSHAGPSSAFKRSSHRKFRCAQPRRGVRLFQVAYSSSGAGYFAPSRVSRCPVTRIALEFSPRRRLDWRVKQIAAGVAARQFGGAERARWLLGAPRRLFDTARQVLTAADALIIPRTKVQHSRSTPSRTNGPSEAGDG